MLTLSEPEIIERGPYLVLGAYATYEGEDEGPGWYGASQLFFSRKNEVTNRPDDMILGFLYQPHRDHPDISPDVRACFVGVEVTDVGEIPDGFSTTTFYGGKFVIVDCQGDTEDEAAMGVGEGVQLLQRWIREHGYTQGDACFSCSHEKAARPPFVEYVYVNFT